MKSFSRDNNIIAIFLAFVYTHNRNVNWNLAIRNPFRIPPPPSWWEGPKRNE